MDLANKINNRIKARKRFNKKTLLNIRWQMIKVEYAIWILLLFALFFPVFPFAKLGIGCSLMHPFRVVLDNVCYGYIAGMIFYLFSDFRPRSLKIFKSKQKLAKTYRSLNTEFIIIGDILSVIDNNGKIVNEYHDAALNVLVKRRQDEKQVVVNEIVLSKIKACFVLIQNDIDALLLMYQDVLTEEEIKNLNRHNNVYNKLHYSSLSEYLSSQEVFVDCVDLDYFIDDFCNNYRIVDRLKGQYSTYLFDSRKFDEEKSQPAVPVVDNH